MKTLGLIGGMSWESSAQYYALINRGVGERLGAPHSARSVMVSVDFGEIERLQHDGDWEALGAMMAEAARSLESAGADCVVLCTNTMHKLAGSIEAATDLPLLHIADPTAEAIKMRSFERIGLLGTAFTMEQDFYRGRLADEHDLDVLIPDGGDRAEVHRVIYEELVNGRIEPASRDAYRAVIERLAERGCEGVILGCTEIGLLVSETDSPIPLFDTTALHAAAAVDFALDEPPRKTPSGRR